jgi:hypothetical protein
MERLNTWLEKPVYDTSQGKGSQTPQLVTRGKFEWQQGIEVVATTKNGGANRLVTAWKCPVLNLK